MNCILHAERLGGARGLHLPGFPFGLYMSKTSPAYIARLRLYIYKNTQNSKVSLWRTAVDRKGRGRPFQGTSPAYIARLRLYIYKNTQNSKVSLWRTAGDRKGRGRPFQGTSPAYIARFRLYIYVKKVRIVRIPSCSQPYRQEMIRLYANSRQSVRYQQV